MKHTTEIFVDDIKYSCTQYPAEKGLRLFTRLSKIVAGPIAMITAGEKGLDVDISSNVFGAAIKELMGNIDEEKVIVLIRDLLSSTDIIMDNGRKSFDFNTHFAGNYGHLFKLLKEVITFQFGDVVSFLAGLAGKGEVAVKNKTIQKIKAK